MGACIGFSGLKLNNREETQLPRGRKSIMTVSPEGHQTMGWVVHNWEKHSFWYFSSPSFRALYENISNTFNWAWEPTDNWCSYNIHYWRWAQTVVCQVGPPPTQVFHRHHVLLFPASSGHPPIQKRRWGREVCAAASEWVITWRRQGREACCHQWVGNCLKEAGEGSMQNIFGDNGPTCWTAVCAYLFILWYETTTL